MMTKIYFSISETFQKQLAHEGKNAKREQSIDLDLTEKLLIEKSSIDKEGNPSLQIRDFVHHYVEEKNYMDKSVYNEYNFDMLFTRIPTQKDLLDYFESEKKQNLLDDEMAQKEQARRILERLEEQKKELEIKQSKEKLIKERNKQINDFVDNFGSETLKLRQKLEYDCIDLAIQEKIDIIENDNISYPKIRYDIEKYIDEKIEKPKLKLLKLEEEINEKGFETVLECWTDRDDEEKTIVLAVTYKIWGVEKTRYYDITVANDDDIIAVE
jgi:hypothetical protein